MESRYYYFYITIFNNFSEEIYKKGNKCNPYFSYKKYNMEKKVGAFKLDTTIKINEENIENGYTFKITNETNIIKLKEFILSKIE